MRQLRRLAVSAATLLVSGGVLGAVPVTGLGVGMGVAAAAPTVQCGQVVTASVTLQTDVGPCTADGIVVGANGITVNLNGHTLFGTPNPGDGSGVLVDGHSGVTVENGTVTAFDGGVVIVNGGGNTVTGIVARDNVGSSGDPHIPDTLMGDGILLEGSSGNLIKANTATDNGPFSGIGLISLPDSDHGFPGGPTAGNQILGNTVTDNVDCRFGPFCDNDGIRLEPSVGPANIVSGNTVTGNGLDGISLFADTDRNTVSGNTVDANGFMGAVPGDGIRIFSSRNLIKDNVASDNAAGGVSVGRRTGFGMGSLPPNHTTGNPRGMLNQLTANHASGNGVLDLWDSNPKCDSNVWFANVSNTHKPNCTARGALVTPGG